MIHLISTAEHSRLDWLPQFVGHYRALGVERFHISVHFEPTVARAATADACRAAEETLARLGTELFAAVICPFDAGAMRSHHDRVQDRIAGPGDWIVWADLDEFQEYPGALAELLREADEQGYDFFAGSFVDRVAADGRLVNFDPARPIWEQYPAKCYLTRDVAQAFDTKVACARAHIRLTPGNHWLWHEEELVAYPEWVDVHHFKWDASVIPRLRRRLEPDWKRRCGWWTESARLLEHFDRNGGGVDPALLELDGERARCASPR